MTEQPDIVERLRSGVSGPHKQGAEYNIAVTLTPETVFAAIDEIERLRADVEMFAEAGLEENKDAKKWRKRAEAAEAVVDAARNVEKAAEKFINDDKRAIDGIRFAILSQALAKYGLTVPMK